MNILLEMQEVIDLLFARAEPPPKAKLRDKLQFIQDQLHSHLQAHARLKAAHLKLQAAHSKLSKSYAKQVKANVKLIAEKNQTKKLLAKTRLKPFKTPPGPMFMGVPGEPPPEG